MTKPLYEQAAIEADRNILTAAEARSIPNVGAKFRAHRSRNGWPRGRVAVWDMSVKDVQSNSPDECLPETVKIVRLHGEGHVAAETYEPFVERIITCRLLYKAYTAEQADARCREIHGTTFDGRYVSGRYWVFWRKG